MPDQIQIKWESYSGKSYDDSLKALKAYDPIPAVKAAINIKGTMPKEAIDQIVAICQEHDADAAVMMTATWGKDAGPNQMRLFGPSAARSRARRSSAAAPDTDGLEDGSLDGAAENHDGGDEPSAEAVAEANLAEVISN